MDETVYVDFEVLAEVEQNDYLVLISKEDLNSLVGFKNNLIIRHWDGQKPVRLLDYGEDSVKTKADASEGNNLVNLPRISRDAILRN